MSRDAVAARLTEHAAAAGTVCTTMARSGVRAARSRFSGVLPAARRPRVGELDAQTVAILRAYIAVLPPGTSIVLIVAACSGCR
jgi:hypothetical protein